MVICDGDRQGDIHSSKLKEHIAVILRGSKRYGAKIAIAIRVYKIKDATKRDKGSAGVHPTPYTGIFLLASVVPFLSLASSTMLNFVTGRSDIFEVLLE